MMHKIEVFLSPATNIESLEGILFAAGVFSLSITEMQVFDKKETKSVKYRGVERIIRHNRKLKVEIITKRDAIGTVIGLLKTHMTGVLPAYISDLSDFSEQEQ